MIGQAYGIAFDGVEPRRVVVQCALGGGLAGFTIVGLPDKAISEARERVRAALGALSIGLPQQRITIYLSPADLPKEGAHFDLPIALSLLVALGVLPPEEVEPVIAMGALALDGRLEPVAGALPGALCAAAEGQGLICPAACGAEAAWVGRAPVFAAASLAAVIGHLSGQAPLQPARAGLAPPPPDRPDLAQVCGQERAKRALEIAAAGRHHILMLGPPGSGKSMLARCLPGLLPDMTAQETLESALIHSLAGRLDARGMAQARPFQDPHHTASAQAIIGGGRQARPGEISLAHHGVLFLDELPEFPRNVLDSLRQPLETGEVLVARAEAHLRYPCRFLLAAAANPCRCGHLGDPRRACRRAPDCGADYLGRLSGPLVDRIDLRVELPAVPITALEPGPRGESSAQVAQRVQAGRARQAWRWAKARDAGQDPGPPGGGGTADGLQLCNADLQGAALDSLLPAPCEARRLLATASQRLGLSARGYHRVLRMARTIADLDDSDAITPQHMAEALSFRGPSLQPSQPQAASLRPDADASSGAWRQLGAAATTD